MGYKKFIITVKITLSEFIITRLDFTINNNRFLKNNIDILIDLYLLKHIISIFLFFRFIICLIIVIRERKE